MFHSFAVNTSPSHGTRDASPFQNIELYLASRCARIDNDDKLILVTDMDHSILYNLLRFVGNQAALEDMCPVEALTICEKPFLLTIRENPLPVHL